MPETILIVDTEPAQLRLAESIVKDKLQYRTVAMQGGKEAIAWVAQGTLPRPDLVLLALGPAAGGVGVIRAIRKCQPSLPVLVLAAYGDCELATQAVQAGANDFSW